MKQLFVFAFLLFVSVTAFGQRYEINYSVNAGSAGDPGGMSGQPWVSIEVTTETGGWFTLNNMGSYATGSYTGKREVTGRPNSIKGYGTCPITGTIYPYNSAPYCIGAVGGGSGCTTGNGQFFSYSASMNMLPMMGDAVTNKLETPDGTGNFCGGTSVRIRTPHAGLPIYNWQWHTDPAATSGWSSFSFGSTEASINGGIVGYGVAVYVRVHATNCGITTATANPVAGPFVFYPPAPTFATTTQGINPTCFQGSDGSIQVNHSSITTNKSFIYTVTQYVAKTTSGTCSNIDGDTVAYVYNGKRYCPGYIANFLNSSGASSFLMKNDNKVDMTDIHFKFTAGLYTIVAESNDLVNARKPAPAGQGLTLSCPSAKYPVVMSDPPKVAVSLSTATDKLVAPKCSGGNDGSAKFVVSYGKGAYSWRVYTSGGNVKTSPANEAGPNIAVSGIYAGTYNFEVTDVGCAQTASVASWQIPAGVTFTATSVGVSPKCFSDSNGDGVKEGDGSVSVTVDPDIADLDYDYELYKSDGTLVDSEYDLSDTYSYSFSGLIDLTYYVKVTTSNECTDDSNNAVLGTPGDLNMDATVNRQPTCSNSDDGRIRLTGITKPNGTAKFDYSISNGINVYTGTDVTPSGTIHTINGIAGGPAYTVTITDKCKVSATPFNTATSPLLTNPAPVSIGQLDDIYLPCYDGTTSPSITVTGGTADYKLEFTKDGSNVAGYPINTQPVGSKTLNNLSRGAYRVIATENCTDNVTDVTDTMYFAVTSNASSAISSVIDKLKWDNNNNGVTTDAADYHLTCDERTDGRINIDVKGGVQGTTRKYVIELLNGTTVLANNLDGGSITGGTSNADGSIRYHMTNLSQDIAYKIRVTDFNSSVCIKTYPQGTDPSLALSAPEPLTLDAPNLNTDFSGLVLLGGKRYPQCKGESNGVFTAKFRYGNPPYTVKLYKKTPPATSWPTSPWKTNSNVTGTTSTFTGLGAGQYMVELVDQQSCVVSPRTFQIDSATSDVQVSSIVPKIYDNIANTHTLCYGDNNAEITVSATGGVGRYSYTLFNKDSLTTRTVTNSTQPTNKFVNVGAIDGNGDQMTFAVRLRDELGCKWKGTNGVDSLFQLTPPDTVEFSWKVVSRTVPGYQIPCYGDSATVRIASEGGKYPHKVTINGRTETITGPTAYADFRLPAGTHTASFRDELFCVANNQQIVLLQPGSSHVQISAGLPVAPVCIGGSDGQIPITASGGIQNLTTGKEYAFVVKSVNSVSFDTDTLHGTNVTFSRPAAGFDSLEYHLKVIDRYECISLDTVIMPMNNLPLTLTADTLASPSCNGGTDGFIKLTASNYDMIAGTSLTFKLSGGHLRDTVKEVTVSANTYTFTDLQGTDLNSATPYNAWVEDAHYCVDTAYQYLEPLSLPSVEEIKIASLEMVRPSCFNGADGSLQLLVSGGVTPYNFSVNDTTSFQPVATNKRIFLDDLMTDDYIIFVRDANYKSTQKACFVADTFAVDSGRFIRLEPRKIQAISCKGGMNGSIDLRVSVDNRPDGEPINTTRLSYSWTHDDVSSLEISSQEDLFNLSRGTYTVRAIYDLDTAKCQNSHTFIVSEPTSEFRISDIHVYDASCGSGSDGRAVVSVSGGWADSLSYYQLDNGPWILFSGSSFILNSLSQGTHSIEIAQSGYMCSDSTGFQINAATFTLQASSYSPTCPMGDDGAVSLSASMSGAEFAFADSLEFQTLPSFSDLKAGTYTFIARQISDATCISNEVTTIVTDPADCGDGPLTLQILGTVSSTCTLAANGEAEVRATGGTPPYRFFWNGVEGESDMSGLSVGNHQVSVIDAVDTVRTLTLEIESLGEIAVTAFTTLASCETTCDGAITLLATGGSSQFNVTWEGSSSTEVMRDVLCPGQYRFTVSDYLSGLCSVTDSISIDHYPGIIVTQGLTMAPTCSGGLDGFVTVDVAGGSGAFDLLWSNGSTDTRLENTVPETYSLTIADRNLGCTTSEAFTLPDVQGIEVVSEITSAPLCHGDKTGSAELVLAKVKSPLIRWADGQIGTRASKLKTGFLGYSVTNSSGCSISDTVEIPDRPALITTYNVTDVTCNGTCNGSIELKTNGGVTPYFISWSSGQRISKIQSLCSEQYTYTVTDNNNCQVSDKVRVDSPEKIIITETKIHPTCANASNGNISVSVAGGVSPFTYSWDNAATTATISELGGGKYTVQVTDANLCAMNKSITLVEPTEVSIRDIILVDPSCPESKDGQIRFESYGGTLPHGYAWEDGVTSRDHLGLTAGEHNLIITDAKGCTYSPTFRLRSPVSLSIVNVQSLDPHCFADANGSISLEAIGGSTPYEYAWNTGATTAGIQSLKSGSYSIVVSDSKGCTSSESFVLSDPEIPKITGVPASLLICTGSIGAAEPDTDWARYEWTGPGGYIQTTKRMETSEAGTYTLTAWDARGCPGKTNLKIEVSPDVISADFLRISEAVIYEPIVFVDISQPVPNRVEWIVPDNPDAVVNSINGSVLEMLFLNVGEYEIGMKAYLDKCSSELRKVVEVREPEGGRGNNGTTNPSVREEIEPVTIVPYPNPASRHLELRIHSESKEPIQVRLIGNVNSKTVVSDRLEGYYDYLVTWDFDIVAGVYFLVYEQNGVMKSKRVVVIR